MKGRYQPAQGISRSSSLAVNSTPNSLSWNRQRNVAVFAVEVFGQVEQQGADGGEGLVAVGDEGFVAGVGGDGEEGG
jgi:hypothetical protein